jgi:vacuolar-type H+-ATPase subunit C/Vma6
MTVALDLPTLAVRARGLSSKLFPRAELEEMAGAGSPEALARELERRGRLFEPVSSPPTVAAIESAVRHSAAHLLRILSVWTGPHGALEVFYAEEDRRSLRALFRGALQAAPSEARLAGLLPTPWLPERALTTLARQPTPARLAAQLVLLHHPEAARLSTLAAKAQPVLLDLERALVQGLAERTLAAARAGDRNLCAVVRARIDVCNMQMALAFTAGPHDVEPATLFTAGGEALPRRAFLDACSATSAAAASDRLVHLLAGTALEAPARVAGADPVRLEAAALDHALTWQRRVARIDPLGSAPLVSFLLRLQAQSADLRRLAWGASLGAPPALLRAGLVTPWT